MSISWTTGKNIKGKAIKTFLKKYSKKGLVSVVDRLYVAQIANQGDIIDYTFTDEDALAWLEKNQYMSAVHVLFLNKDSATNEPLDEAALAAKKAELEALVAQYKPYYEKQVVAEFGEDEEAAQKYFDEVVEKFNEYQKEPAKANLDNIVGLMAISEIMDDDTEELKALLDGLSDEMKARPEVARMIASFETLAKTGEGQPFVDFTVVQEPAVPEASTVKFSDYVGNGKFVLVDFWASWCGPCREEMPNLKHVYETYAGPNFDMLSIAVADQLPETLKAAEELGISHRASL